MSSVLPPDLLRRVHAHSHYRDVDYELLVNLYGLDLICRRLDMQMRIYDHAARRASRPWSAWIKPVYRNGIRIALACSGQLKRAREQARNPQIVERDILLPTLPQAFDGFRILHLTDFHFDYTPGLVDRLAELLKPLEFDICVLTGDYRGEDFGPYEESVRDLERLRPVLGQEVYGILGNHDCIELMLHFPTLGIHGLLNDSVWLERDGARLLLAGIDDPHWYQTHDFAPIRPRLAETDCSILLAHSPEIFREAAAEGFDVMLCGHTHGGQICLPGGFPLVAHLPCSTPRALIHGTWREGAMQGYTSRGAGTSSVDCRLNCRGEITLHTLRCNR